MSELVVGVPAAVWYIQSDSGIRLFTPGRMDHVC
jgi:hypothetical protein